MSSAQAHNEKKPQKSLKPCTLLSCSNEILRTITKIFWMNKSSPFSAFCVDRAQYVGIISHLNVILSRNHTQIFELKHFQDANGIFSSQYKPARSTYSIFYSNGISMFSAKLMKIDINKNFIS